MRNISHQKVNRMFQLFNQYPYNTKKYRRYEKYFQKFRKQKPYNIKKVKKYLRLLNNMSTSLSVISLRTQFVRSEMMHENMKPFFNQVFKKWLESEKIPELTPS